MFRLALDVGTSSIGWWIYELADGKPVRTLDAGVRIFSDGRDPKTGASLAVERRNARAMRRRRDRYLRRRAKLVRLLADAGLLPADPAEGKLLDGLDPYELRARGLDEALPLQHLGRALFHLNQRRGFKSNRTKDRGDNEGSKIASGTARLDQAMIAASARTYGEFLHKRRASAEDPRSVPSVRTRLTVRQDPEEGKSETGYDFYPDRRHLEEEFAALWQAQAAHHPDLTEALRDVVFEAIFYQRPLKRPAVGRCAFYPEPRLPKAHPLTQQRVLYETVNALRVAAPGHAARPLTREERDTVVMALNGKKPAKGRNEVKLSQLAKLLKLAQGEAFTLETTVRDAIACDPVRASLAHADRFGSRWSDLSEIEQIEIVRRLQEEPDREALVAWLVDRYGLDEALAGAVADAPLPEGYARLGETATRAILAALRADVITYDKAVALCGLHHSDLRSGEVLDRLPYYGEVLDRHVLPGTQDPSHDDITRFGRLTNPTVHIGLNQLRRVVNRIIETYGKPHQIVVELARDLKQSEEQKRQASVENARNLRAAQARSAKLLELGIPDTGANRMVLRLWEDMHPDPLRRLCPYTGKPISAAMLFSGECDVDHILPYSRTLDDSIANRTLCLREANREKRNRSPWEAWGGSPRWALIAENLENLHESRRWRFAPDAMAKFEGERDFVARALVDTQYLSRLAREYLDALYTEGGHVWVVAGRLTEMLRRNWGLNGILRDPLRDVSKSKNRQDHRHHAIDAAVIGATDRALVQQIARLAGENVEQGLEEFAATVPPPWNGFRDDVAEQVARIVVSHRADHGRVDPEAKRRSADTTTGALHNDTAYGLTGLRQGHLPLVVTRKPLDQVSAALLPKIRDRDLAGALEAAISGQEGKDLAAALAAFRERPGPYRGIRRVRIIEATDVVEIRNRGGRPYKGYKPDGNHCIEIWRLPEGKYIHQVIRTFDAHQGASKRPHPAAKRILRLYKSDMVRLEESRFGPVIATVEKFDKNGRINLVAHHEGNASQRYRQEDENVYMVVSAAGFVRAGGRRIIVNELGRVRDPGPRI